MSKTKTRPQLKAAKWEEHARQLKRPTKRGHRPYAPNWHGSGGFCQRIRALTCNRCINCLGKATLVHHFYYRKGLLNRKVYGIEGYNDGAPLCDKCHGIVHSNNVWIVDKKDPDCDRNTPEVIGQLRLQFWAVVILCRAWWLVLAGILVLMIF